MRIATFFVFSAVLFPVLVLGQQPGQYQGPLRLGSLQGNADFSYTLHNKDTVFEGSFSLKNSNISEFAKTPLNFLSIEGEFDNHIPIGDWHWRRGEFFATGKGEVKDHHYRLRISGREDWIHGSFSEGAVHGNWELNTFEIDSSEVEDTLLSASFSFERGIPDGDFYIRKRAAQLEGEFQDEGFADGVWRLRSDSLKNQYTEWHYSDGLLARIVHLAGENPDTLAVAEKEKSAVPVFMDERYFKILELKTKWNHGNPVRQGNNEMADLVLETLTYFRRTDSIMNLLSQTEMMPQFRAKLVRYSYTNEEEEHISAIAKSTERAQRLIKEIQRNPQFNLLKLSDEEISYHFAAVSVIEQQFVRPIDTLLLYHQEEILEFLPRERLLENLLPESNNLRLSVPFIVEGESTSRPYTMRDTSAFHGQGDDLAAVEALSEMVVTNIESISEKLDELVREKHREKELVQLEENLMTTYEGVQSTIDSLENESELEDERVWNSLRQLAEKQLSQYSALDDASLQYEKAKELLSCFENIEKAAAALADIPAQKQAVEKAYTRKVWNPYTYTYMEETVKKRILSAYTDMLLPYLLKNIAESPSCETLAKSQSLLKELYQKVMELRTQKTNRLERKLGRAKKPAEALKLLDLDPQ